MPWDGTELAPKFRVFLPATLVTNARIHGKRSRSATNKRKNGGSWILGHVRRRDEIANEKIAAAARRTFAEVIPTTSVAVRTIGAA